MFAKYWKWIVANELNEKYCEWVSDKMANKNRFPSITVDKSSSGEIVGYFFIPWSYTEILSNCDAQPWWCDEFQWDQFSEVLGLGKDLSNCHFLLACNWVWLSRVWLGFLITWRRLHQVFIDVDKILWAFVRQKSLSALLLWQDYSPFTSLCLSLVSLSCVCGSMLEAQFLMQPGKCCSPSLLQGPMGAL